MTVRKFEVARALESARSLNDCLEHLTEPEVLAALDLESSSRRRQSVIDRLISRAVRLNEVRYSAQLKERYRGN
jgi:hypothetical protein